MASSGEGAPAVCVGFGEAGIIVVLHARGVSASKARWGERGGEEGAGGLSSSVAVSISWLRGGAGVFSGGGAERHRAGEGRWLGQSLNRAGCSPPRLVQWDGEEQQQPGVALRLPPLGQVGFGHWWFEREWLREHSGHTVSSKGQQGATWPKPQQFLHCV